MGASSTLGLPIYLSSKLGCNKSVHFSNDSIVTYYRPFSVPQCYLRREFPFRWIYSYLALSFIEAGLANKKNNLPSGGTSSPEIVGGVQKSF